MNWIHLFLCVLLSFASITGYGQKSSPDKNAQRHFEKATKYIQLADPDNAIDALQQAIEADPDFASAYQQLGDIYRSRRAFAEAVKSYKNVLRTDPTLTTLTYFGLGECLLFLGKYQEAADYLQTYSQNNLQPKSRGLVEKYLADCRFSLENKELPKSVIHRLSSAINSVNDEYFPKLTADDLKIIFTRKEDNQENFYESQYTENQWSTAQQLVGEVNSSHYNEGAHCISPDGKYLFFTGCNRPNGMGSCDIYISKKENGRWSTPSNLGAPVNTKGWEAQPAISADGRTLYFVSNRPGGFGGNDIWKTELGAQGSWSIPVNLGPTINSAFDESAPFIHADNTTLYFSSNGWPGYGGQDLFKSQKDNSGLWQKPVNIGAPINNHFDQTALHVNMRGTTAFFATQDSSGQQDIFSFDLPPALRPHPVAYISGTVRDKLDSAPLSAKISVTRTSTNSVVFEDVSDPIDGKFIATLPIGSNYAVHVQCQGYLFYSKQYDLSDHQMANENFTSEILLSAILPGSITRLDNIHFDSNSFELLPQSLSELQILLLFLKNNPDVQIEISGHTDNTGTKVRNQELSENRANAVSDYVIRQGISSNRIRSKGYGDQQPVTANDTTEGRKANRRTEIRILK